MKVKNLFLFGAGASYGCNGTNEVVPLGGDLFIKLKDKFPETWGALVLSSDFENVFKDNFEKGMSELWKNHRYNSKIPPLMQDMAVYFSKFKVIDKKQNLYYQLFNEIKNKDLLKETVLSTINYDCLIEEALEKIGIKYKTIDNVINGLIVLKIHGSCNYIPNPKVIKAAKKGIDYSGSNLWCNVTLIKISPEEVDEFCKNSSLYPGMAIYMKGKPVRMGSPTIDNLQKKWQVLIQEVEEVFIIGVNPNLEDHHIWNYIHKKDQVFYCGCKSSFNKWQREQGRNDIFLDCTFENSIEDIIKYSLN